MNRMKAIIVNGNSYELGHPEELTVVIRVLWYPDSIPFKKRLPTIFHLSVVLDNWEWIFVEEKRKKDALNDVKAVQ